MIIAIWGPPGSGKSSNASFLQKKYGAKRVVDEYRVGNGSHIKDGDLLLIQKPHMAPPGTKLIYIVEALKQV